MCDLFHHLTPTAKDTWTWTCTAHSLIASVCSMQALAPHPTHPSLPLKLPLIYLFVFGLLRLFFLPHHEQSSCILSTRCFYRHQSSMLLEGSTFPMTTAAYTWTLIPAKAGVSVGFQSCQSSKCYNPFNYHTVGKITAPGIKERMSFSFNLWHDVSPKQNDLSPMSHHRLLKTAPSLLRGWSLCSVSQGNIYQLFSDASVFSSSELVLQSSPATPK